MKDKWGRSIDYMRISVTDRCNFRCAYCMPAEGMQQLSSDQLLSFDEILKVAQAGAALGISKFKVTGGELFMRPGILEFLKNLKLISGVTTVSITTNGSLLEEHLEGLKEAGIDGINISLDTLDPDRFRALTRGGEIQPVLSAIQKAVEMKSMRIKVNCVPMEEVNVSELTKIAGLAREFLLDVRFIELMPLGQGKRFHMLSQERVASLLEEQYGKLEPEVLPQASASGGKQDRNGTAGVHGNGPAVYYRLPGFQGSIGFISALSHEFCSTCSRIRMLADGSLKTCLNYGSTVSVRELLRRGAGQLELEALLRRVILEKPARHGFENQMEVGKQERYLMSSIGG